MRLSYHKPHAAETDGGGNRFILLEASPKRFLAGILMPGQRWARIPDGGPGTAPAGSHVSSNCRRRPGESGCRNCSLLLSS